MKSVISLVTATPKTEAVYFDPHCKILWSTCILLTKPWFRRKNNDERLRFQALYIWNQLVNHRSMDSWVSSLRMERPWQNIDGQSETAQWRPSMPVVTKAASVCSIRSVSYLIGRLARWLTQTNWLLIVQPTHSNLVLPPAMSAVISIMIDVTMATVWLGHRPACIWVLIIILCLKHRRGGNDEGVT